MPKRDRSVRRRSTLPPATVPERSEVIRGPARALAHLRRNCIDPEKPRANPRVSADARTRHVKSSRVRLVFRLRALSRFPRAQNDTPGRNAMAAVHFTLRMRRIRCSPSFTIKKEEEPFPRGLPKAHP